MPLPWVKTELEFLEKVLWIFQVSKSAVDIDVTEFSLIDFLSALRTVTSDSFVVENYQVLFLRSKTRLKKTDKGGLRTKRLRKDSTAEEGLVVEKLQR